MRKIDLIVIHCTATRVTRDFPVESLEACPCFDVKQWLKDIHFHI